MLHIAICDDDPGAVSREQALVEKTYRESGASCKIRCYTDSRNLLADILDDGFFLDLLLLDIEMPGLNGMELPQKLRPCLPEAKIIFVTSHREYAIDAFELSIFRYIPKAELEKRLPAALRDAAGLILLQAGQSYTIETKSRLEKIPLREIYYIQREGKNACIVSARGLSKVRKSLQQVFTELNSPDFLFIDRGCIVNISQVMRISGGMALLKNGQALPISRGQLQAVKTQINAFWGAHIG